MSNDDGSDEYSWYDRQLALLAQAAVFARTDRRELAVPLWTAALSEPG